MGLDVEEERQPLAGVAAKEFGDVDEITGLLEKLRFVTTVVLILFFGGGEFGFKVVGVAPGFVYEPSKVPGYLGELARAENYQKEKPDDHHLLYSDAKHGSNTPLWGAG